MKINMASHSAVDVTAVTDPTARKRWNVGRLRGVLEACRLRRFGRRPRRWPTGLVVMAVGIGGLGLAGCGADPSPIIGNATAGDGQAMVSWQSPPAAPLPITAYVVTPWIGFVRQTPVVFNANATGQTVTGLTSGVTYTFTVHAVNANGDDSAESGMSNQVIPGPAVRIQPPTPPPPITVPPPGGEATPPAEAIADTVSPIQPCEGPGWPPSPPAWYRTGDYGGHWPTSSTWWEYKCTAYGISDQSTHFWTHYYFWDGTTAVFYGTWYTESYDDSVWYDHEYIYSYWTDAATGQSYWPYP